LETTAGWRRRSATQPRFACTTPAIDATARRSPPPGLERLTVVHDSPPAVPALPGLAVAAVEWLPSGAESGLIRVRGRWTDDSAGEPDLPVLALRAASADHRFDSLPDARFTRDPRTWRGTYLVPAELVVSDPDAMWLEWPSGARSGLPALTRGVEPPPVPAAPERPEEPDEPGGQVIDRAVLAERRARRAEAAEQAQARVAAESLKAVEVLELRSAELERRLEEATAEHEALGARDAEAAGRREALAAALASAAALRSRSREWQLRLRTTEVARAGDSVRLAVLEAERATGAAAIRTALQERSAELEAARRQIAAHAADLAAATEAATTARSELEGVDHRFAEARAAWERRREELEASLADVRAQLAAAREQADDLQHLTEDERAAHEHIRADLDSSAAELRDRVGALEAALAVAEGRIQTAEAALVAAEARLRVESVARSTLEDELDRERAQAHTSFEDELERERAAMREAFEAELERERAAMRASFEADLERERAAMRASFDAELERRAAAVPEQLERLAREQAEAAAAHEPAGGADRLVADLDAAADALRRRAAPPVAVDEAPAPDDEPPAPDAEPAVEWADSVETDREPCVPGVEPVRAPGEAERRVPWAPPGFESTDADEPGEPPAPDAEPGVEWTAPVEPPPERRAVVSVPPPSQPVVVVAPEPTVTLPPEPVVVAAPPPPPAAPAPAVAEPAPPQEPVVVVAPTKPAGPVIVPAARPPSRGLMVGSDRRDYPLLRGAIVKLAHDDPDTAARLLAALLPAQGVAIDGPLAYDLTIRELGTFGVAIAGGRASVERLDAPHSRAVADFHLIGDAVTLAELIAGVDHRIGRFFGPVRARGRKRKLKQLRPLTAGTISLGDAARAGARLDPELAYRVLGYAVHPSWTRGHDFTIAQEITGDPPETWYLTASDGAGVTVATAPPREPDATVTMTRDVFDRLLRSEPVPAGRRPCVRGDFEAVARMREWTDRARGA
jgi:hypothetical protein